MERQKSTHSVVPHLKFGGEAGVNLGKLLMTNSNIIVSSSVGDTCDSGTCEVAMTSSWSELSVRGTIHSMSFSVTSKTCVVEESVVLFHVGQCMMVFYG